METKDQSTESAGDQEMRDRLAEAQATRRPSRHPDPEQRIEHPDVEAEEPEPERVADMKAAARGELKATDEDQPQQVNALDYLLAAFHDDEAQEVTKTLRINVGSSVEPRTIRWKIRSIPGPLIRSIRESAEEQVRRRRGAQTGAGATTAAFQANVRVVIEGTVEPNIKEAARTVGLADSADFLETALNRKQLLIDQIAGEILTLSGGDEEDVQDDLEVQAAGNSSS